MPFSVVSRGRYAPSVSVVAAPVTAVNSLLSLALASTPSSLAVHPEIGGAHPLALRTVVVIVVADNTGVVVLDLWDGAAFGLDWRRAAKVVGSRPKAAAVVLTFASTLAAFRRVDEVGLGVAGERAL